MPPPPWPAPLAASLSLLSFVLSSPWYCKAHRLIGCSIPPQVPPVRQPCRRVHAAASALDAGNLIHAIPASIDHSDVTVVSPLSRPCSPFISIVPERHARTTPPCFRRHAAMADVKHAREPKPLPVARSCLREERLVRVRSGRHRSRCHRWSLLRRSTASPPEFTVVSSAWASLALSRVGASWA